MRTASKAQAAMIEQVLDVDAMRVEIADLSAAALDEAKARTARATGEVTR